MGLGSFALGRTFTRGLHFGLGGIPPLSVCQSTPTAPNKPPRKRRPVPTSTQSQAPEADSAGESHARSLANPQAKVTGWCVPSQSPLGECLPTHCPGGSHDDTVEPSFFLNCFLPSVCPMEIKDLPAAPNSLSVATHIAQCRTRRGPDIEKDLPHINWPAPTGWAAVSDLAVLNTAQSAL